MSGKKSTWAGKNDSALTADRASMPSYHEVNREWPRELQRNGGSSIGNNQSPIKRWQSESVGEQPYHNIQGFWAKAEQTEGGDRGDYQNSSIRYLEPDKEKR